VFVVLFLQQIVGLEVFVDPCLLVLDEGLVFLMLHFREVNDHEHDRYQVEDKYLGKRKEYRCKCKVQLSTRGVLLAVVYLNQGV
jgi:hypothetical protein